MEISIQCAGAEVAALDELVPFQGDLKDPSAEALDSFKKELLRHGFSEPISIWKSPDGIKYILNGHQRHKALSVLRSEGYSIPPLPVSVVEASSPKEAREK